MCLAGGQIHPYLTVFSQHPLPHLFHPSRRVALLGALCASQQENSDGPSLLSFSTPPSCLLVPSVLRFALSSSLLAPLPSPLNLSLLFPYRIFSQSRTAFVPLSSSPLSLSSLSLLPLLPLWAGMLVAGGRRRVLILGSGWAGNKLARGLDKKMCAGSSATTVAPARDAWPEEGG